MYCLRCGIVHQGAGQHVGFGRVCFTLPQPNVLMTGNLFTLGNGERCVNYDAADFCNKVIRATERWYAAMGDTQEVKQTSAHCFSIDREDSTVIF